MQVKVADSYGFCFGVKRAIKLAEETPNSVTLGPLIHNPKEINRLENNYNVKVAEDIDALENEKNVIIRTHGIPKNDLDTLHQRDVDVTDATCPFVIKPQEICQDMDEQGYDVVIFGDINHPEIKGIMSYVKNPIVVLSAEELEQYQIKERVAIVAQTTKRKDDYLKVVNKLIVEHREVRVFNTICNATFDNQDAAFNLSKEVDIMLIIGGKNSSNTTQLYNISKQNCDSSYLIEDVNDIDEVWFKNRHICGITAGASTPDWIVDEVMNKVRSLE
jgi:4-hydroxy-3-methylbut-2-enyl diphosphate reductase